MEQIENERDAARTEMARKVGLAFWGLLFSLLLIRLGLVLFGDPHKSGMLHEGELRWAEAVRTLLIALSFGVIVYAYAIRTPPRVRARGLGERVFPMLVLAMGFGFVLFRTPTPSLQVYLVGVGLCVVGFGFSLWSLLHLRGSLSVMAEVRELVRSGPYGIVRHPLYLGEMINWAGLAVLSPGWGIAAYTATLIGLQATRARIEERKFIAELGDPYLDYRREVGFLWPRLGR
jgi:protein-S-isoprenylcysteine O-methyltransferase Ste14